MKKIALLSACAAAILTLPACTPKPMAAEPPAQRARQAYLARTADTPITCTVGPDCTQKWARALEWVTRHSVYSIKTSAPSEIATNGPIEPTTDSAFTVTMTPQDTSTSAIHFSSTCGSQAQQTTAAQCTPTSLELASGFNNYVLYGQ